MGIKTARRYCPNDGKYVLAQMQTPNHILHLLLTLLTLGGWIVVWLIIAVVRSLNGYRCPECGGHTRLWAPKQKKA